MSTKFDMKLCPLFIQLCQSRHQLFFEIRNFYFEVHLKEKGNSKLSKSLCKSTEIFYNTGNIIYDKLTKSYK